MFVPYAIVYTSTMPRLFGSFTVCTYTTLANKHKRPFLKHAISLGAAACKL